MTEAFSFKYDIFNGIPYLYEIHKAIIETPQHYSKLLNYTSFNRYKYNNMGRIIQIINNPHIKNNQNTKIIWGYNGLYPVAILKANNGSFIALESEFDKLLNLDGLGLIDTLHLVNGLSDKQDEMIRKFTKWEATTYEYIPFFGISKIKNPSGRSTYYQYTTSGKLWRVRDHDNNTLISYSYSE